MKQFNLFPFVLLFRYSPLESSIPADFTFFRFDRYGDSKLPLHSTLSFTRFLFKPEARLLHEEVDTPFGAVL